jgi:hypothetical protein
MMPTGITPVFKLKSNFVDLESLYKFNQSYPKVRFCGGNLFAIKGCNIGCCGISLLNAKGINYDLDAYYRKGLCNCALEVHEFSELHNIKIVEEQQQKIEIELQPTVEQPKIQFSDLFGSTI